MNAHMILVAILLSEVTAVGTYYFTKIISGFKQFKKTNAPVTHSVLPAQLKLQQFQNLYHEYWFWSQYCRPNEESNN